jgi:hypothetical protein
VATDEIKGTGTLRTTSGTPAEWKVTYQFAFQANIVKRPGFPHVAAKIDNEGKVTAPNGDFIPEGLFRLTAEDGEILDVQNVGLGTWTIFSSIA